LVRHPHQRRLADLPALRAPGRQDDDRQPDVGRGVPLCPAGTLEQLHLIAHPPFRARLVLTLQRHESLSFIVFVVAAHARPCVTGVPEITARRRQTSGDPEETGLRCGASTVPLSASSEEICRCPHRGSYWCPIPTRTGG